MSNSAVVVLIAENSNQDQASAPASLPAASPRSLAETA
jgi:hypothetical protein